jgi:hypothetical protein
MSEWQDSFKTMPNEIFMHQIRSTIQEIASNYVEPIKIEIPVHKTHINFLLFLERVRKKEFFRYLAILNETCQIHSMMMTEISPGTEVLEKK